MTRSTRCGRLAAITTAALLVPAAAWALGPVGTSGPLADLAPTDPTLDGATARVQVVEIDDGTLVSLKVHGVDRALAGRTLGAHLHVGGCTAGDATGTGAHYNSSGGAEVSPTTEVWLDFTVTGGGTGHSIAKVPFTVPGGGAGSVVVHAAPTAPSGAAGAKLACLPVAL